MITVKAFMLSPEVLFFLTLLAYILADKVYQRSGRSPFFNPIATGSIPLGLFLLWQGADAATYEAAGNYLLFLLAPAVVTLGVPIYTYRHTISRNFLPIMLIVGFGAIIAAVIAVAIAFGLGAQTSTLRALAAKSVTTPIAIEIVRFTQGNIPLIVAVVVLTGIFGAVVGPVVFKIFGIKDEKVIGLVLGVVAHGVGTARAFDISAKAGAFASLGMALCGIITAIFVGVLVMLGV